MVIAEEVPLPDQIACVLREIAMRQRLYPQWVEAGKMKQDRADREIEAMRAVLDNLNRLLAEKTDGTD